MDMINSANPRGPGPAARLNHPDMGQEGAHDCGDSAGCYERLSRDLGHVASRHVTYRDRLREEWQRNPSSRRFDLYVFPVLVAVIIAGLVTAIMSPHYRDAGRLAGLAAVFLIVALNYAVRRPRSGR
jgi:hypothetical protein